MHKRPLGKSPLSVAPLAFGGNVFGWSVDEKRSFELLDAFVEAGGNLIDTADVYSAWVPGNRGGESEAIIGKWLRRSGKREQVVIASKVAKWVEQPGLSPTNIRQALDGSLKRLQVDCIDLYQAHEDDASVPLAETLGEFGRLIEAGKIRVIGASNYSAARLADALAVSTQHGLPRYESVQPGRFRAPSRSESTTSPTPSMPNQPSTVVRRTTAVGPSRNTGPAMRESSSSPAAKTRKNLGSDEASSARSTVLRRRVNCASETRHGAVDSPVSAESSTATGPAACA